MAVRGRKPGSGAKKAEALIPLKALTPVEAEARRTQLKNLIILGKERGFLTYAEINDHLPDEVLDADQIEGVISMLNDMGIQVYDEAPDAETLLMNEAAPTMAELKPQLRTLLHYHCGVGTLRTRQLMIDLQAL